MHFLLQSISVFLLAPIVVAAAGQVPVREIKDLAFAKQSARARALFEAAKPAGQVRTPEWLEAMSWVARAGAIAGDWALAGEYAQRTLAGCEDLLATRSLDEDPEAPLPIALGAAIETLAKKHAATENRGHAIALLRQAVRQYAGTAVETRLNKNLLLLDLVGKPMPPLDTPRYLSARRLAPEALRGKPTLVFFWAHWCSDCLAQKPILDELGRRYAARGLRIVAPTRLYGYAARGVDASPAEELAHMREKRLKDDPLLERVPVPLSGKNFVDFGVSTTPTLVLVDREGIVRLYHPGFMEAEELAERIEALL